MKLHPAKFTINRSKEIFLGKGHPPTIAQNLHRGACDVFLDECGTEDRALLVLYPGSIRFLEKEIELGAYDKIPQLREVIQAMSSYISKNPSNDEHRCFVLID